MTSFGNKSKQKIIYPKVPQYLVTENYCYSKLATKLKLPPYKWDIARTCPEINLNEIQLQFEVAKKTLEKTRQIQKEKRQKLDEQWKDIEKKLEELREKFEVSSQFVSNNDSKRERGKIKLVESKKLLENRIEDVKNMEKKIDFLKKSKVEMDKKIQQYLMYENYLDTVVQAESSEFKNIPEITERFDTLMYAKHELAKRQSEALLILENSRADLLKLMEESTLKVMGLNCELADLNTRYLNAHKNANKWESIVLNIKTCAHTKQMRIENVKQSLWNLCLLIFQQRRLKPTFTEYDYEKQFVFIKKTFDDLQKTNLKMKSKDFRSTILVETSK